MTSPVRILTATALAALAGCSAPPVSTPPTPSPSAPPTLGAPQHVDGTTLLAEVTPTSGHRSLGTIAVQPGDLWVSYTCIGDGDIRVELSPSIHMSDRCHAGRVQHSRNREARTTPAALDVQVIAGDGVQWALRVEQ